MRIECCKCRGNITAKYFYKSAGKTFYGAYCGKHTNTTFWLTEVTKEDYLAHKAMEAL